MSAELAADPLANSKTVRSAGSSRADDPSPPGIDPPSMIRRVATVTTRLIGLILRALTSPIRFYFSLRRSMTVASVSVLLAVFMTLNVIWGFPWSGMLGACVAMLGVGFAINRLMQPRLSQSVSLPRSAVAGQPFSVDVRLTNRRIVPAMNLRVGWQKEGIRDVYRDASATTSWESSEPVSVDLLRSGDQMQWHGAMRFFDRGIQELPPFHVVSTFPFHLFYCRTTIDCQTRIAVTPTPISRDDDLAGRVLMSAVGEWAKQLVKGAPVEYVGNREYQEGVPVRRWDFASWARLGRPIVREYQSPSIQSVTLLVDTGVTSLDASRLSRSELKRRQKELADRFELLMSIAATSIIEISSRRVQLSLVLTSESENEVHHRGAAPQAGEGFEVLLVRLAAAEPSAPEPSERRIRETLEHCRSQPVLILSLFDLDSEERGGLSGDLPPNVTYLPVRRERSDRREELGLMGSGGGHG